jgi:hypothetical protein
LARKISLKETVEIQAMVAVERSESADHVQVKVAAVLQLLAPQVFDLELGHQAILQPLRLPRHRSVQVDRRALQAQLHQVRHLQLRFALERAINLSEFNSRLSKG